MSTDEPNPRLEPATWGADQATALLDGVPPTIDQAPVRPAEPSMVLGKDAMNSTSSALGPARSTDAPDRVTGYVAALDVCFDTLALDLDALGVLRSPAAPAATSAMVVAANRRMCDHALSLWVEVRS